MKRNAYLFTMIPIFGLIGYAVSFRMASPADRIVFGIAAVATVVASVQPFARLYRAQSGSIRSTTNPKRRLLGLAISAIGILSFCVYMNVAAHAFALVMTLSPVAVALVAVLNVRVYLADEPATIPSSR